MFSTYVGGSSDDIIDKMTKTLKLDELEREILLYTAGDKSLLFAPGLDIYLKNSFLFQNSKRIKDVYIAAEKVLELYDEKLFNLVAENLERGVNYHYFLRKSEAFRPFRRQLEIKIGEELVKKHVTCVIANNDFLLYPGFLILDLKDPDEVMGLHAKWFHGRLSRVYKMDDSFPPSIYDSLRTAEQYLELDDYYDSDGVGKFIKEFPKI